MIGRRARAWRVGGASIRGDAHVRRGAPNQDCWLARAGGDLSRGVLAVSDGHGARVHFRSDKGAELAVNAAVAVLEADLGAADGEGLARTILARWRTAVRTHMTENPYSDVERLLASYPPLSPYGATLIAAGLSQGALAFVQIGDGDLIVGYPDGRLERPLPAAPALDGERTFSLCQEEALGYFQTSVVHCDKRDAQPDFVFMSSDGVSKSFLAEADFLSEIARLRKQALGAWPRLIKGAPAWLADVSKNGSGDDATLCIAVRAA